MCGIFGFAAAEHGIEPDERLLELAAVGAADRGPHAHGWAVPGEPTHRALGPLQPARVPRATRLLGHARLATYGRVADLAAVQPISIDGHRVVHNGNAPGVYADHPTAPSDTAALAIVYAAHRLAGHAPPVALTLTTERLDTVWALAVLDSDGSLVVSRRRLPLHVLHTTGGLYLSSSGELPGCTPVPEQHAVQLAEATPAAVSVN